ncbi:MAG: trehalase family glycosidase [bacterium]
MSIFSKKSKIFMALPLFIVLNNLSANTEYPPNSIQTTKAVSQEYRKKSSFLINNNILQLDIPAISKLQDHQNINFIQYDLNKVILYNSALQKSDTLGNPAIYFLISGKDSINDFLKYKDHKKYADAILKTDKSNWRNDPRFKKLTAQAEQQIKNKTLSKDLVEKIENLIEEYYILPDENKGFDDQIKISIELPNINFKKNNLKEDYVKTAQHIHQNWKNLVRKTPEKSNSTLIPLPNPYVIPGGRFREMYYWDSYFTILGLKNSKLDDLAKGMTENFLYLVKQFGFVPNGNRIYYLSRSQPPFLAMMAEEVRPHDLTKPENKVWLENAYKIVAHEYKNNWMNNMHYIKETGLNRYFDPIDQKRPESFGYDNANLSIKKGFYQDERSECESGLDFSPRFSQKAGNYIPVDLNCLLYKYETLLENWAELLGKQDESLKWRQKAEKRKLNIIKYLYNPKDGLFYDYDFKNKTLSGYKSIATAYPLWVGLLNQKQAKKIRDIIVKDFESKGGILTSPKFQNIKINDLKSTTEYQWGYPNGWAPIQWITIDGLNNYGFKKDAKRISEKWINLNTDIYQKTGKLFEKYNVVENNIDVNTSYPQQDGFGWTNGVYLQIFNKILSTK